MAIDPWSDELKTQIHKFGDKLLSLRKLLAAAKENGVPARQLDMAEIDLLLEEYEKELSESAVLQKEWAAKQPELQKLQKESDITIARMNAHEIHNDTDYQQAQRYLEEIDVFERKLNELFDPYLKGFDHKMKRLESIYARVRAMCRLEREGNA